MRRVVLIIMFVALAGIALSNENFQTGLNEADFNCIAVHPKTTGLLFAGSNKSIYRSFDAGKNWKSVYNPKCAVNSIIIDSNNVYAATARGLYASFDAGITWKLIYRGRDKAKNVLCLGVNESFIFLGTEAGLFRSEKIKHIFKKINSGLPQAKVFSLSVIQSTLCVATNQGVFKSKDNGLIFDKLLTIIREETDEVSDADEGESENPPESQSKIRFITLDKDKPYTLYLGTDDGIKISSDGGLSWRNTAKSGLLEKRINFILLQGKKVYAGTKRGLYIYDQDRQNWQEAYKGIPLANIKCLSYDEANDAIWIASDKGIYKISNDISANYSYQNGFSAEPDIKVVQNWAIEYAEVQPEKIARWRKQARLKALLPKVSVGCDQSKSDTYEIYTSATRYYYVGGPEDKSRGWDVTLSWELGDLIWSTDQTSIDVRSRLMVELRNDILEDVTRTYFERRRLQIELADINTNPKKRAEKQLRIEELTANLDALTGGRFSNALKSRL
ncbi:MAG: hypothetical protein NC914_02610 [Candidatus Omnitrophica bacterium]|nr:hypothetical protein [Candidatus Omnitrophota bacterium]